MKKRVLSMIIAIVMVVGLIPAATLGASAASSTKGGLTVTGGTEGVDFEWGNPIRDAAGTLEVEVDDAYKIHLIVKTSTPLTVTGTGTSPNYDENGGYYGQTVRVAEGVTANVTFDGVTLKSSTMYNSPVVVHQNATLNLTLKGNNSLSSGRYGPSSGNTFPMPAIFVKYLATLVVTADSTGTLTASSDIGAAVIGGQGGTDAKDLNTGTIKINGGTFNLTANGSNNGYYKSGACIGAGNGGAFTDIEINGGTINGNSEHGAVIGGGYNYITSNMTASGIVINGGVINATTPDSSAQAIGSGYNGTVGTIQLNGGLLFDDNNGKILGTSYTLTDDLTVPSGKTLTVNEGQTLTITDGKALKVDGTLVNNGTVDGKVVAPPALTLTAPVSAATPGSNIKMSVVAKNAFDESSTDVPTEFKISYKVGASGSVQTVDGLNFTVPSDAALGETLYVYAQNVAVDGKYTVGTSNTVELFVGQVDYSKDIEEIQNKLYEAVEDLNAALSALETTLGGLDAELDAFVQEARQEIELLQTGISHIKEDLDELEKVVGDENSGLVKALNDAVARIAEAESRLDEIDTEIANAKARLDTLESEMDAAEGRLDAAEAEIIDAKARLAAAEAEISAAKGRLDAAEAEIVAAKGRLDVLEDEMDAAEDRLDDAEGRLDDAEGRLDDAEGRLDDAEGRLDDAEGRLDDAEGRLDDAEGRLDDAEGRLDAAESEIERLEEEKATRVELTQARRELTENYLAAIDEAKAELNAAIAAGDADLADKIEKLNTALNDAIKAYKDADAALKAELQGEFNGKIDAAKTSLETAIAAVQTNLDTAKSALEAADGALDKKIGDLETALKAADAALAAADETNKTELKAAIESAKTDLQKAIKDGDDKAAADLAAAVEALKAEIAQAEKDARTLPLILAIVAIVGDVALLAWIVVLKRKI